MAVTAPGRLVVDGDRLAVHLELPFGAVLVRDGAVHHTSWVPQQVEGLHGPIHHPERQLPLEDKRLHRADPGRAVSAQGADERQAGGMEAGQASGRQFRSGAGEISPGRHGRLLRPSPHRPHAYPPRRRLSLGASRTTCESRPSSLRS